MLLLFMERVLRASTPSLFSLALGEGHVVSGSQARGFGEMPGWGGWAPTPGRCCWRGSLLSAPLPLATEQALCAARPWREARTRTTPELRGKGLFLGTWGTSELWCAWRSCPGNSEAAAVRLAGVRRPRCCLRLPPAQRLSTRTFLAQDEVPICLLLLPAPPQDHVHVPSLHSPLRCPSHLDTTPLALSPDLVSPRRWGHLCLPDIYLAHPGSEVWGPHLAHRGCSVRVTGWPNNQWLLPPLYGEDAEALELRWL